MCTRPYFSSNGLGSDDTTSISVYLYTRDWILPSYLELEFVQAEMQRWNGSLLRRPCHATSAVLNLLSTTASVHARIRFQKDDEEQLECMHGKSRHCNGRVLCLV